ncbi:galactoside O-acetyltransferase [Noviherbaspirillum humi]|uniref:Galactoside O-acetyltransferase n=1 Tax=Noviherbaspirillum humi TaxID=1688639 RepID=A0A239CWB7_9BURK|nr:acyltransferase [Noviherbaspirillum humi]SNS23653.1 galactoside O-acetyltransferase [Noviherbaspirillum humi]
MSYLAFLRDKAKGYSLGLMLRLEFESLFFGLAGLVPTTFGVFVRAAICKLFLKSCRGLSWIQPRVTIVHGDRITVGSHFAVNSGTYINGFGGIEMGSHVLIGSNVTISSGQHPIDGRLPPVFARQSLPKKIVIEDDVWIGAGAVIMPGVRLAQGTVVGANAVVTRDTEPYSIVVGAPAHKIRNR